MSWLGKNKANIALALASSVVTLLLAEGLLSLYRVVKHGAIGREELIASRTREGLYDDVVGGAGDPWENRLVLHPLFGYSYNPNDEGVNNFGFYATRDIRLADGGYVINGTTGEKALVIGVFGGSFADLTGREHVYLEQKLQPAFPGRQIVTMNMAVGGHALPQSAFIYLYFRELFDVVVFIDGLNEVWNYTENNELGFPPEYAKAFHYNHKVSRQELTPVQVDLASRVLRSRRRIHAVTSMSLMPVLRSSLVIHHVWRVLRAHWSRAITEASIAMEGSYKRKQRFFDVDDGTILKFAARQWGQYHLLVHQVAAAQGSLSLHLLQPNPLVAGSKTLTPDERQLVANSYPIQDYVLKGYPRLQEECASLESRGLVVEDLTGIFKDSRESIWTDAAHVNKKGEQAVIDRLASLIKRHRDQILRARQ